MNFTEAVAEVLSIVKRPDKISDIRREINAAISFYCLGADFARDFNEGSFPIDATLYAQQLALSTFSRFRKFAYIKPPAVKYYIENIGPNKVFTGSCEKVNTYYISGSNITFKLSALTASLLVGWYSYPPVLTDAAGTFWLLDVAPYMVIDRAAAMVFSNMGDDASAKPHMANASISYLNARADLMSGAMP